MERIRIIVVGAGGNRGAWFVEQLAAHTSYRITGLVDSVPQATQAAGERYQLQSVPVFSSLEDAFQTVDCDAVLVATPDGYHVEPVCTALRHGAYVYVEKPLAITLEDCVAIVRADEEAGRHTMVGFNLRFAPLYRQLRQMIREGAVGRLLTIQADEFYYGGRTYFRRWNRLRRYSGGLWITKASHDFDLLYWLAGALPQKISASARLTHYVPKPEAGMYCHDCGIEPDCPDSHFKIPQNRRIFQQQAALRAETGTPPPDLCLFNSEKDTFDHGVAQVEFDNDLLAVYTLNVVAPFTDRRIRIGGAEGTLEGSLSAPEILYWRRHQDTTLDQVQRIPLLSGDKDSGHGGGDQFVLDDFAAFVRGESSQAIGPAEASVAVAMGLAATQASDSGQGVEIRKVPGWRSLRELASSL
jgi:predicted dehydrogenase